MGIVANTKEEVALKFPVYDIDGLTPVLGLADVDFIKVLVLDDAISALPVVVDEVGQGVYAARFTPDVTGLWYVQVQTPFEDVYGCHLQAAEDGIPTDAEGKIAEIHRILGLDPDAPLCVSKTGQVAGNITLKQSEVGAKVIVQREE